MARKNKRKLYTVAFSILALLILWFVTQTERNFEMGEEVRDRQVEEVTPEPLAPEPVSDVTLIRGVVLDDIDSTLLDRDFNFGKGRLGAFVFNAPHDGNFRIEEMVVAIEGAREGDVDEVWLSINGVSVFSTASFNDETGVATFTQFPPIFNPGTSTDEVRLGVDTKILEEGAQRQLVITADDPLPQIVVSSDDIRMVLYGHWGSSIAPRDIEGGLRLCLLSLKGSIIRLVGEDTFEEEATETKFAAPQCWNTFGIDK